MHPDVARWLRYGAGLAIYSSQVQYPAIQLSHSDHRQVIDTRVPLFTKQYKLVSAKVGDALKLGR